MNLKKRIDEESRFYKSAEDHSVDHLKLAQAVLFEEFEGRDFKGLLSKIDSLIEEIYDGKRSLELINYEGPVLSLIKLGPNKFQLLDQWKHEVQLLTRVEVLQYITGEIALSDSTGREWRHLEVHIDARPSLRRIDEFIYN